MSARRHHFVPQGYLEGFAADSERPQLQVFDLAQRKTYTTSPINIAVERDFNRVEIQDRPIDELEVRLGQIESEVIAAIRRIATARSLAHEADLHLVLNLVGLIFARNPRFRHMMETTMGRVARGLAELTVQSPEHYANSIGRRRLGHPAPPSYEDMKEFVDKGEFDIAVHRNWLIGQELAVVIPIIEMLAKRKWSLLVTNAKSTGGFVTSDHPACLNFIKPMPGPYGPGLGLTGTSVLFPLNRELCILGEFEGERHDVQIDFLQVAKVNGAIVASAHPCVFAADDLFVFLQADEQTPRTGKELLSLASSRPPMVRRRTPTKAQR